MTTLDLPDRVRCWRIGHGSDKVRSWNNYQNNRGYSLFCQTNGEHLTYGKQKLGINLVFKPNQEFKTHFRLPDGLEREVLFGERVAFGIGGGEAFLRYGARTWGINLNWSGRPAFEWRVVGGQNGTPIPENSSVAIVNEKVEPSADFLIYLKRAPGHADIGWTTSPGFWDSLANWDRDKLKRAKEELKRL